MTLISASQARLRNALKLYSLLLPLPSYRVDHGFDEMTLESGGIEVSARLPSLFFDNFLTLGRDVELVKIGSLAGYVCDCLSGSIIYGVK